MAKFIITAVFYFYAFVIAVSTNEEESLPTDVATLQRMLREARQKIADERRSMQRFVDALLHEDSNRHIPDSKKTELRQLWMKRQRVQFPNPADLKGGNMSQSS